MTVSHGARRHGKTHDTRSEFASWARTIAIVSGIVVVAWLAVAMAPGTTDTTQTLTASQPIQVPPAAQAVGAAMSSTPVAPQALPASEPVRLRIPQIDVDADVVDLGLNPDGTLEVPTDFEQTGWYTGRSTPGEAGPLVVAGHVDSFTGPAVFFRLRKLEEGSEVLIDRADGQTVLYRVSSTSEVAKDSFPTDQVYGLTAEPTLRLITCGGTFDHDEGSWVNNLIVYADYLGVQPATAGTTTAG